MNYMTTNERIKEIRKELKQKGYSNRAISIKNKSSGYSDSINITIKDMSINKKEIQEMAQKHESYETDKYGEILQGANTYIFIDYDYMIKYDYIDNTLTPIANKMIEKFESVEKLGDNTGVTTAKQGNKIMSISRETVALLTLDAEKEYFYNQKHIHVKGNIYNLENTKQAIIQALLYANENGYLNIKELEGAL